MSDLEYIIVDNHQSLRALTVAFKLSKYSINKSKNRTKEMLDKAKYLIKSVEQFKATESVK